MEAEDVTGKRLIERVFVRLVSSMRRTVFNGPQKVFETATGQETADLYVIVWLCILILLCSGLSYSTSAWMLALAGMLAAYRLGDLLSHHSYSMFAGRTGERSTAEAAILIAFINLIQVGLCFGILFLIDEHIARESFVMMSGAKTFRIGEAVYYSFVTLTTLGASDITAVRCGAKVLTVIEVFVGLALIVLILGRHLARHSRNT